MDILDITAHLFLSMAFGTNFYWIRKWIYQNHSSMMSTYYVLQFESSELDTMVIVAQVGSLSIVGTSLLIGQRSLGNCFTHKQLFTDTLNKEFHHDTKTMPLTLSLLCYLPLSRLGFVLAHRRLP